eukprot:jgi/Botrbrau1/12414/Bobra.0229s0010.1
MHVRRSSSCRPRRRNWEQIFDYVTKQDVAATLAVIEEANRKVEEALSEGSRERNSVASLKTNLIKLKEELAQAQNSLHLSEARLETNLKRIRDLQEEAHELGSSGLSEDAHIVPGQASTEQDSPVSFRGSVPTYFDQAPILGTLAPEKIPQTHRREPLEGRAPVRSHAGALRERAREMLGLGLTQSGPLGDQQVLWYPVAFSSKLQMDAMIPFDLMGVPWVLFRDSKGEAACLLDICAHRACPISAGSVAGGKIKCPYHGWEYQGDGRCTSTPSTSVNIPIRVDTLPTAERDGLSWVAPGGHASPGVPSMPPSFAEIPEGHFLLAEVEVEREGVDAGTALDLFLSGSSTLGPPAPGASSGAPSGDRTGNFLGQLLEARPSPRAPSFHPPASVTSYIDVRGWDGRTVPVQQLYTCLPSRQGSTRALLRLSCPASHWPILLPAMRPEWDRLARQGLERDLNLMGVAGRASVVV